MRTLESHCRRTAAILAVALSVFVAYPTMLGDQAVGVISTISLY